MLFELWLVKIMPYTKPIMIISNETITIARVSKSKMSASMAQYGKAVSVILSSFYLF